MNKNQLSGRYSIVGVGEAAIGKAEPGQTAITTQARAAQRAMLDCGLKPGDIDGVFAHWGDKASSLLVLEYLGLKPTYTDSTLVGGQSSLTMLIHAIAAIEAGLCEVALITYGSTQRLDRSRNIGGLELDAAAPNSQFVRPYGMVSPIGFMAMYTQLHQQRYGSSAEDLGEIAIASRKWAQLNPAAIVHEELTMEKYLQSPMICEPLRKADICKVSDGAGALILTSRERAKDLSKKPVQLLGFSELYTQYMTPFRMDDWLDNGVVPRLLDDTLAMAQCSRDDVDLVQIYDACTINVLSDLEELGFCERGEAGDFVKDGRIAPGGDFPLNTSGGGLSFHHAGMFGMPLTIESVRQLRGECGDRQVDNPKTCLMRAGGFVYSAHLAMLLGVE